MNFFHGGLIDHKPYGDMEWQANAFAWLLTPAHGIGALERMHSVILAPFSAGESYCHGSERVSFTGASRFTRSRGREAMASCRQNRLVLSGGMANEWQ